MHTPALAQSGSDVLVRLKVVPGASRGRIMGMLGDRLKIAVSAPPENGKANQAVCALLAKALGLNPKSLAVEAGHTHPHKTIRVSGADKAQVAAILSACLPPKSCAC